MKKVIIAAAAFAFFAAITFNFFSRIESRPLFTATATIHTVSTPWTTTRETMATEEVVVVNPLGSGSDASLSFKPPRVRVVIGVNNTVTWVNEDLVPHKVTSMDRDFDFLLQPGEKISYTFTSPGTYEYFCTLHPWMNGVVEVLR